MEEIKLPVRHFTTLSSNIHGDDDEMVENYTFSVVQYNMLASSLCNQASFPHTREAYLDREHRLGLTMKLFENVDGGSLESSSHSESRNMANIYALEEVDEHEILQDFFTKRNYFWFWKNKPSNLDGCAVAIDLNRFQVEDEPLVEHYRNDYQSPCPCCLHTSSEEHSHPSEEELKVENKGDESKNMNNLSQEKPSHAPLKCDSLENHALKNHALKNHNQMMILVKLIDKLNGRKLILMCTHLKAKEGFEEMRHLQVRQLIHRALDFQTIGYIPIICGDFNEVEHQIAIQEVLSHKFTSVYPLNKGIWTTWKKRSVEICRMIDYIFYNTSLLTVWKYQNIMQVPEELLPARNYPSDHIHLYTYFSYSNNKLTHQTQDKQEGDVKNS